MDTNELKFLLKLLGCSNYRSLFAGDIFKDFKGKDKVCQNLGDRELVDYSREIAAINILPPGGALLQADTSQLSITDRELKVLQRISKAARKIKPGEIGSVKAPEREEILQKLADRGLIEVEIKRKREKAEVWLTDRGLDYLRYEFTAKGANAVISLDLLTNYLRFLRQSLPVGTEEDYTSKAARSNPPDDEEILQVIRDLDRELGTENYLPIFNLRQKLQPLLLREELDGALYRLEAANQIELSTLAEPRNYTREQLEAGISQASGGWLFFITVS